MKNKNTVKKLSLKEEKRIQKEKEMEEAKNELLSMIEAGDKIYLNSKHTSQSGMYRVFNAMIPVKHRGGLAIVNLDMLICKAADFKYDNGHYGIGVTGVGMDMGFYIVNSLSNALFNDGNKLQWSYIS